MGLGVRIHFFEDEGSIKKIPYAKFNRLISRGSDERLETYAGKRVRCAMTFVEIHERKAAGIIRTDFMIIPFASNGGVDREEYDRGSSLAINMIEFELSSLDKKVVDIVPKISRRRYIQEFTWAPTQEEINAIINDVLPSGGV